ncbi:MAG: sensor domain-containing phosphodiesterase [Nocardioidaceae bacterium]
MTAFAAIERLSDVAAPAGPQTSGRVIQTSLATLRKHLGMDVAFLGRFYEGRRWFEFVDADSSLCPVQPGGSDPLEESYCARVVDGRLPQLVRDATREPAVADLPATTELPVGAHLSVPLHRSSGELLGTLCCFSHQADPSLRERDIQLLRMFADLVSVHMEALLEHDENVEAVRTQIRSVLSSGGPLMAMQPVVDLATERVVAYEALARFTGRFDWTPDRWFVEASQVGLGPDLEASAIASALRVLPRLPQGAHLAVNISPATLLHTPAMDLLTGQHAPRLVVELTEHDRVDSYEATSGPLARIRRAGARVAVDDAGSGYAGLEHILQLQPEVLKLDRQVVTGLAEHPGRQAMVDAMVGFARRTGATVVAEGVETADDVRALRESGVEHGQGWHLGRPSLEFSSGR